MSSPTPPPAPSPNPAPARKKPSALASCILLGLILGALGVIGGGGFWAYKTFISKSEKKAPSVASKDAKTSTPPAAGAAVKPAPDHPVAQTTPSKPRVIESPGKAETKPDADTVVASVNPPPPPADTAPAKPPTTPAPPEPPANPPTAPTKPGTTPANPIADTELKPDAPTQPLPEPDVAPAPAEPDPVVAAEPIQTFAENDPQVAALKADADRRIDEAPAELYSDADKQRVREAIRRAKRLTRVATLQFGAGAAGLGSNEKTRLKKALLTSEVESLLSDPEAVFFILGFADATGASDANRRISQKRAAGVADVLKGFKVSNSSYAVGIGATTLLSAEKQARNRATEVWIVLP